MESRRLQLIAVLATVVLLGCTGDPEARSPEENSTVDSTAEEVVNETRESGPTPAIMQIVRLKSSMSEADLLAKARERQPEFEAIPGLIQKYYVKLEGEGEYSGVYLWDSRESLQAFRQSELAATIAEAYQVTEPPSVEVVEILFQLRE